MTAPTFTRATRRAVKLKLAVQGPSGSGKTLGALALAHGLARGERFAVIDTENGSAALYADRYAFDTLELRPPYTSDRYLAAIRAAVEAGYPVVVVDSFSHQWAGEGGILSRKDETDARGGNQFTNWAGFTKEHEAFKAGFLNAQIHVIATLRSKQEYVIETGEKGKQKPRKVGMAPIQREGLEYEFTTVWELQMDHRAAASKDRTGLFALGMVDLLDAGVARKLLAWLESAPAPAAAPAAAAPTAADDDGVVLDKASHDTTLQVYTEARRAGLTKATFPAWYQEVLGRPYKDLVFEQDVQPLLTAAAARIAEKGKKATQPA